MSCGSIYCRLKLDHQTDERDILLAPGDAEAGDACGCGNTYVVNRINCVPGGQRCCSLCCDRCTALMCNSARLPCVCALCSMPNFQACRMREQDWPVSRLESAGVLACSADGGRAAHSGQLAAAILVAPVQGPDDADLRCWCPGAAALSACVWDREADRILSMCKARRWEF